MGDTQRILWVKKCDFKFSDFLGRLITQIFYRKYENVGNRIDYRHLSCNLSVINAIIILIRYLISIDISIVIHTLTTTVNLEIILGFPFME